MKVLCIYHDADLDGLFSAAQVALHYQNLGLEIIDVKKPGGMVTLTEPTSDSVTLYPFNYGDSEPISAYFNLFDKVYLVDITLSESLMADLYLTLSQSNIIWLDHHRRTIDTTIMYLNGELGPIEYHPLLVNNPDNLAGCELVWKYLNPDKEIPKLIEFLGAYDTFRHIGTINEKAIFSVQFGLRSCVMSVQKAIRYLISMDIDSKEEHVNRLNTLTKLGVTIIQGMSMIGERIKSTGIMLTIDGVKFFAVNAVQFDVRAWQLKLPECDGYIFYSRTKRKGWKVDFRTDSKEVNCADIAAMFKGGGHPGAAGCYITYIDDFIEQYKSNEA